MHIRYFVLVIIFASTQFSFSQERIDDTFPFQTDPAKQYSIYVPSAYDLAVPNKMMLGLHPFNTSRWNSISWCDTLIAFAEANNLLLICPDGGPDGRIDDPIDVAFTTVILDSMEIWYNVDVSRVFAMGFSWGGRATYTYGLNNTDRFAGFMPIGAAINGTNEVNGLLHNATDKPYYIIHGSNDSPNTRFTPIRDSLVNRMACVETEFMLGVGHTIDFPNRNAILTEAFNWLDLVSCGEPAVGIEATETVTKAVQLYPNPVKSGALVQLTFTNNTKSIAIYGSNGEEVWKQEIEDGDFSFKFNTEQLGAGIYLVKTVSRKGKVITSKLMVF